MSKKIVLNLLLVISVIPFNIYAKSGCCSHHGGVSGCSSSGRQICRDGTLSPTCSCNSNTWATTYIYGCTDKNAKNYNAKANKDNGNCVYYVYGCTNKEASNYNSRAEKDDGSCIITSKTRNTSKSTSLSDKKETDLKTEEESSLISGIMTLCTIAGGAYLVSKVGNK